MSVFSDLIYLLKSVERIESKTGVSFGENLHRSIIVAAVENYNKEFGTKEEEGGDSDEL